MRVTVVGAALLALLACSSAWAEQSAKDILKASGVRGGLIVHLNCGDGKLTADLHADDAYLVHGLATDAKSVQQAREHIQSLGLYGPVAAERFGGEHLPYVDNLVNLVVAEDLGGVSTDEVMRVLCPNGVAYVRREGKWTKTVKPRPEAIDEWTHYLYDARGNAVSQDMTVGPPRHFQWTGSPRWARHHDRRASVSAMVSAGGRIFYIFDEGSTASILLPPKTMCIARDAFNGTILWKREMPTWHTHLWPFKSGPAQLQRRLVAVDDVVYVTLGLDAPLVALDAATGETLRTYEGTLATEEVLCDDGVLFLLVNPTPQSYEAFKPQEVGLGAERDRVMAEFPWDEKARNLTAVQAETGEVLWTAETPVAPLTPAVDDRRVYFHDGEKLVALDRNTGKQMWTSDPVERQELIPTNITPTLVVHDSVVLYYGATRTLFGVSAETGEVLWSGPHPKSGHYCPEDVLVAGGLVWGGEIAGGRDSGEFIGRDPKTGEVKSRFLPDVDIYFMHHRCYRSKATDKWLIPGWTGTEFVDFRNEHWITNHWVRGGCIYGVMPCNGLVYTTPHSCACYMQSKLYGFCALAAPSDSRRVPTDVPEKGRLERGPVYSQSPTSDSPLPTPADWPTYRRDGTRSGSTKSRVPAEIKPAWQAELGGKLSSPVVAGGRLFVASVDAHAVHALDASSGETLWSFTAGGRVDSPPTIYQGRALFGSADGYVYCLRASDGALIWRFRAAPKPWRMTSFEQVESVWPVSGSVLVEDAVVYCVAGRSMFLDGGLRLIKLDAATGKLIAERVLDQRDPVSGENLQKYVEVRNMPVGLPDVLSSDGKRIYMRSQVMDLEGNRTEASLVQAKGNDAARAAVQKGEEAHLFSPTGFLDDTWWHRSYWVYGRSFAEGAGGWPQAGKVAPGGRILAVDDSSVYGFGRKPLYYTWRTPMEYHLFASPKAPEIVRQRTGPVIGTGNQQRRRVVQHPEYRWSKTIPMLVRAMVLAGETLFIAGPPDVVDEEEAFRRVGDPEIDKKLAAQDAAMLGAEGAALWAVSATNGEKLAELELDALPRFDGLIAAAGRLYMTTTDGRVLCLAGR